jgi:ubiquinone/menaquinone biosynthesis C-methylase UbiE
MEKNMAIQSRKDLEREFHNTREELRKTDSAQHDAYYVNRRFYRITGRSREYIDRWFRMRCPGKQVLDYCCGTGETSVQLAGMSAWVTGIDISDESIATAQERAGLAGVAGRTSFYVMDAENLAFADNSFDVIVCRGVLHHLNLAAAYPELARVLKPGGAILCIEALAHNPIIHWYRRKTPHLRTAWEVDHILTVGDIYAARAYFEQVNVRFFHLAAIAAIPFVNRPGFRPLLRVLNAIDDVILTIPLIDRQAWQGIFTLSHPRKGAAGG